jgi:trehalose 6-phosphate synthase/phosphatase
MSKNIIVSNRLPVQINIKNDLLEVIPSVGGLATGMKSVHADGDGIWIGWSGLEDNIITRKKQEKIDEALLKENVLLFRYLKMI